MTVIWGVDQHQNVWKYACICSLKRQS